MNDEPTAVPSDVPEPADAGTQDDQSDQAETPSETPDSPVELSDIPEEYRGIVEEKMKSLQADYTRKTQDIADARRKAEAFDGLAQNEQFAQLLKNMAEYGSPTPPQPQAAKRMSGEEILLGILDQGEEFLDRLVNERAQKVVAPLTEAQAAREAQTVIADLSSRYPDFESHADTIAGLIESGVVADPEAAYKLATYDQAYKKGMTEATRTAETRSHAAGATKGANAAVSSERAPKTIQEAYDLALKQHGR